jgi:hypothetical protein
LNKENAFTIYLPDKRIKFTKTDQGLYVFKPKIRKTNRIESQFVNTIDKNKTFFTTQQVDKAKQARELYHALGTPSIQDFKAILCMNLIANNPVTTEDIEIAKEIFGPDIGSLNFKTIRKKPALVVNDYIKIPPELTAKQQNVTLCINGMKVNGLSFLTTISKNICYRTAQFIASKLISLYKEALKEVIQIYNKAGFKIIEIRLKTNSDPSKMQCLNTSESK